MAGVRALLLLLGAPIQLVCLDIFRLIGCVAEHLVRHFDIGVVCFGPHHIHGDSVEMGCHRRNSRSGVP